MTDAELLARFTDISEKNLFSIQFGDGAMLTGLPPNDIYQLGFFAAFNECHLAVREFVDQKLVKGILDQQAAKASTENIEDMGREPVCECGHYQFFHRSHGAWDCGRPGCHCLVLEVAND